RDGPVLGNPHSLASVHTGGGAFQTQTQRRMEKLFTDQRVAGWSTRERTAVVDSGRVLPPPIERRSLQGYMFDAIEVTSEVADSLLRCCDFRPSAFSPRAAPSSTIPMATHLR
ncbi:unnamed protein product, partial [Pylaiella littoralis]